MSARGRRKATAINDRGQIVGISGACDDAIGQRDRRSYGPLGRRHGHRDPNLGGDEWNTPTAINERGDVAGFSDHPGDVITEAFLWTPEGGLRALGFLYDDHTLSEAFGMNEGRQIVGLSCGAECRAFLWQDGAMLDLNELIAPDDSVLLTHAMDINDDGVITGRALIKATGERVTFVATPTGSPIALGATTGAKRARPATVSLTAEALREILQPARSPSRSPPGHRAEPPFPCPTVRGSPRTVEPRGRTSLWLGTSRCGTPNSKWAAAVLLATAARLLTPQETLTGSPPVGSFPSVGLVTPP